MGVQLAQPNHPPEDQSLMTSNVPSAFSILLGPLRVESTNSPDEEAAVARNQAERQVTAALPTDTER